MQFTTRKTFGPKISLTKGQIEKLTATVQAAGYEIDVENCRTGSCYVSICERETCKNIRGDEFTSRGDEIAKIRLSGHDEGKRQDSTHCVVGSKSECLESLARWIDEVIAGAK